MGQVLISGLDDGVIERLKQRAESHDRSLESELRAILKEASRQIKMTSRKLADPDFAASSRVGDHTDSARN